MAQRKKKKTRPAGYMKLPNGFGSIVELKGNRRKPFEIRTATTYDSDSKGHYDVIDYAETWLEAFRILDNYNQNPYDIKGKKLTFTDVYSLFYKNKYEGIKEYSDSSKYATRAAFNHFSTLHTKLFTDIKRAEYQKIIDNCPLRHASLEHMIILIKEMYQYAIEYEIVSQNRSDGLKINKPDDDEHGIPWSKDDISKLWDNIDLPNVDLILLLLFSGWRAREMLMLDKSRINLNERYMVSGSKTTAGKERIVPIHPALYEYIKNRVDTATDGIVTYRGKRMRYDYFRRNVFIPVLKQCNISKAYTLHDCRHTFATLLDEAGVEETIIKKLMGHAINDITQGLYVHKNLSRLRNAIESVSVYERTRKCKSGAFTYRCPQIRITRHVLSNYKSINQTRVSNLFR